MTEAEKRIWYRSRAHRLNGSSFRRQAPIGAYIVDFLCFDARLIVEVDGGQHDENQRDKVRDAWLASQDFTILRFWNNDVLKNTEGVIERIVEALSASTPPSLPLPRKGGGNPTLPAAKQTSNTKSKAPPRRESTSPLAGEVGDRRSPGGG